MKAFRDTWKDGIHSYLTYLRDRLTVARELLHESGSIFVQIGDENVHRVRAVMDEVFGEENFVVPDCVHKRQSGKSVGLSRKCRSTIILWYATIKIAAEISATLFEQRARSTKADYASTSLRCRCRRRQTDADDESDDANCQRDRDFRV